MNDGNQRVNPACPRLPEAPDDCDFRITRRHGHDRGPAFYQDALRYAQWQWQAGKPAQAVLQLNKAWGADLEADAPVLRIHPPPYSGLVWILQAAADGRAGFLGNPVRHFQHLASRMSGPRAGIRSWRAWACLHLAERVLDSGCFPRDGVQRVREGLWIPGWQAVLANIRRSGWTGEAATLVEMWQASGNRLSDRAP